MESAYLTKAHEHVRNAATATYGSNLATAGVEHEQAASAFHDATQDTNNAEALRILGLLENHHHKLAQIIKEPPTRRERDIDTRSQTSSSATPSSSTQSAAASRTASPSPRTSSPAPAPSRRRLPQPSIASNLAEKRGIPGARRGTPTPVPAPATSTLADNERPSTPVRDVLRRNNTDEPGKNKDAPSRLTPLLPKIEERTPGTSSPPQEDNFRRFYSAFGGVISAISAPLAFTSLPLHPTPAPAPEPEPASPPKKQKSRSRSPETSRTIKSSEPDLTSLISKPALRALREDQQGALGPFANNESFYVVPTSGGTVSYANILRDRDQQAHPHPHHAAQNPHLDSIDEVESDSGPAGLRGSSHEEFVDARETVFPPSPTAPRHQRPHPSSRSKNPGSSNVTTVRSIPAGRGSGLKTMEELQLENETLRTLIDKQAKRLSMWETTSQSSYNALAQSFRLRGKQVSDPSALAQALSMGANVVPGGPSSPPPVPDIPPQYASSNTGNSKPNPNESNPGREEKDKETVSRIASLESLVESLRAEKDNLAKQNEKNSLVIGRYREQWEKLKAGARKKEQERREKRVAELKAGVTTEGKEKDAESGDGEIEVEAGKMGPEGEAGQEDDEGLEEEEAGFGKA
ncbi:hypothetical protein BCR34DRAFT_585267 [Clohesyomyces aquaticus]|uniref:Uncharacterized protein n=1 Tax=Clohesyomyces aquaticus TaxID=1231657 RepID=A0A1Y1ZY02_9PLEO|nr:hypothetical protein BCR34DRAFT_585267 [Clohesyomyces aquaticus]